ncbi:FGGY-family carbohydrate kinase [Hoeflea poritis]|uniref:Carbohydrate kinase n=1 Tax=Hoeflea poritis TaxID=2993659 RepID=A0ABT4VPK2_9HYPH|nr:FGGY-family carbohydrate kinase [Hoeflea poritis]MDA4846640.1 carbohydrate kinase [Hoeflea poritis]
MPDNASYLLGLDAGNTVIKAVLFDLEGRQIAMHALDGQSATPEPGYVERDLNELWSNACTVINACIRKAGIRSNEIAAVGCAGHGNGLYLLDAEGEPLIGVQSLDSRAAGLAGDLAGRSGERFHALCLQKPWPSQTPSLLAWVKRNRPDIYEKAGTALLCKDFITQRLTGERVSDLSDMSGCGMLRLPEGAYDDELLGLYGLEDARGMLPPVRDPSDIVGTVTRQAAELTGLAAGTPVIAGYFDVVASALGSGAGQAGGASIIAGTWSINQVFSEAPVRDPSVFMVSAFGPNRYVNIEASATSAANLEWYVRELVERGGHHDDPFGFCNERIASVEPRSDDPYFHPFLYGSGQGAHHRGGYYGLAGWHGEGHLLRALFEGVVFEHRRHIEKLKSAGVGFDRAILSGGGSRSPHWPQMFADCLGVPVAVAEARETGALGAAIGAAVATAHVGDYEEGLARMTLIKQAFEPDPLLKTHYDRRYDTYRDLAGALESFWQQQAKEQAR